MTGGTRRIEDAAQGREDARLRLLLVDDDQVDRVAFRRTLAATNLQVDVFDAGGVLEAIELLAASPYDCVFLDFNLPDGDGLTFLRGVRGAGITTPVVILTGESDAGLQAELSTSGAADFIPKEALRPARLAESITRVLRCV